MVDKMTQTVQMPYLWTKSPKVHKAVFSDICEQMLVSWTFEDIYTEVVKSGITDDDDILATTRAIVIIRDHRRTYAPKA